MQHDVDELLISLDTWTDLACEDRLVQHGEVALPRILETIAAINHRQQRAADPLMDMAALRRRIQVLGRIRSPNGLAAIFNAVADSAIALAQYNEQANGAAYQQRYFLESYISEAEKLNTVAVDALVASGRDMGDIVIPHIRKYMGNSPRPVVRSLKKALRMLEKRWWQFWK